MRYRDFIGMMRKQAAGYQDRISELAPSLDDAGIGTFEDNERPNSFLGQLGARIRKSFTKGKFHTLRPFWEPVNTARNYSTDWTPAGSVRPAPTDQIPLKGIRGLIGSQTVAAGNDLFVEDSKPAKTYQTWLRNAWGGRNYESYLRSGKLAPEVNENNVIKKLTPEMRPIWDNATPEERKAIINHINGLAYNGRGKSGNKVVG